MVAPQSGKIENEIWQVIAGIPDPEIPVVSLAEMGILRRLQVQDQTIEVTITPTFSGCPALHAMQAEIVSRVKELGYSEVQVKIELSPPWSTDWIADSAREKLKKFGIQPPARHDSSLEISIQNLLSCPFCGSENTEIRNNFGPTPCRALAYCHNCQQPFEWLKPI